MSLKSEVQVGPLIAVVMALIGVLTLSLILSSKTVSNDIAVGLSERVETALPPDQQPTQTRSTPFLPTDESSLSNDRNPVPDEVLGIVEFQSTVTQPTVPPRSTQLDRGGRSGDEAPREAAAARVPTLTPSSVATPTATAVPTPVPTVDVAPAPTAVPAPTSLPPSAELLQADPEPDIGFESRPSVSLESLIPAVPEPDAVPAEIAEPEIAEPEPQPGVTAAAEQEVDLDPGAAIQPDANADPSAEPVPTADAPTSLPDPVVGSPTENRGERLYRNLNYDLAALGYTISFHDANIRFLGVTLTGERHIEIYDRVTLSDPELAHVIAHEIGHAVDHVLNDETDRARWREIREMDPSLRWWPPSAAVDRATPAGDFAECFASVVAGGPSDSAWGECPEALDLMKELASS